MSVAQHTYLEQTDKYVETIESGNISAINSVQHHFSGISFYEPGNPCRYTCADRPPAPFTGYGREQLLSFANGLLQRIHDTCSGIVYTKCVLITEKRRTKLIRQKQELDWSYYHGRLECVAEYRISGKRFEQVLTDGFTCFNHDTEFKWWEQINTEKLLQSVRETAGYESISDFKHDTYDLLLASDAAGTLMHETFGHLFEQDNLGFNDEIIVELSKLHLHSDIRIKDQPFILDCWGYAEFDDSGCPSKVLNIVQEGKLTDEVIQGQRISNCRRDHYTSPLQYRVSNTILEKGSASCSHVLDDLKKGIYIRKIDQCFIDPVTGKIILPVIEAYKICCGQIIGLLSPFTIVSNVIEIGKGIKAVCTDYFETGLVCGKLGHQVLVGKGSPSVFLHKLKI